MLTVTEKVVLVAFDHSGRVLTEATDLTLGYALSSALLVDLALQGHLDIDDDTLKLNPNSQPKEKFLKYVKEFLRDQRGSLDRVSMFRQLYAMNYKVKPLILDSLVEKGYLSLDTVKLKWSFDLKKYSLKPGKPSIRAELFDSFSENQMSLSEYCVMQIVTATSLLRDTMDEKQIQKFKKRMATLSRMIGMTQAMTSMMDVVLPESIAKSHKLGPLAGKRSYASTWEWRGFWLDNQQGPSMLQASQLYQNPKHVFDYSELSDLYLVMSDSHDNVKLRRGGLEVKRPIETHNGYTAYYPKQVFKFPFKAVDLVAIFPRLYGAEEMIESQDALLMVLRAHDYEPKLVEMKKKRFQLKLEKQVKLEFSTLEMNGTKFLTACVEGQDYHITHAHVQNLTGSKALVRNYNQFLREFGVEAGQVALEKPIKKPKKKKVKLK